MFCLDLDGFKNVNDRFGHAAGDALLVAVARRLADNVRVEDFVCRLAGDEFVILLPAVLPGARIIDAISRPFDIGAAMPVQIGVSIGSARAPSDGSTAEQLLQAADRARYEAKRRGRGILVTQSTLGAEGLAPAPADASTRITPGMPGKSSEAAAMLIPASVAR